MAKEEEKLQFSNQIQIKTKGENKAMFAVQK